ncbi:MAG: CBS domain-containing protein [Nitrospirae bacterium]|nr:MAG: CBS domain-containing protein [Nitrospirota bacterium]
MELITTHLNADFDGLASMVAARKLYPGATLALPAGAQETVRSFLAVHDLGVARLKDVDCSQITRLILVDTHEPSRLGPFKDLCSRPGVSIHVYDHHPAASSDETPPLRPDLSVVEAVGATTTILIEQLHAQRLSISPFEATVLAIGLYEETGSLAYASTTPRDLDAAAFVLRAGADLNLVSDTLRRHLDPDQIAILNDLLQHGETHYVEGRKVFLSTSTFDRYRGDLAEVVHKLAEMEGFDAVLAAVAMEEKVEIIGRSRRPEIDVGRILEEFGGGGHAEAAAASVKGRTLVEIRERLTQLLAERFRPTLLAQDVMTKPVKAAGEEATVLDVEGLMTKYGVNVLPVLDARERFRGLMTREIVQKALFHGLAKSPVREFVQTEQYRAAPETPFHEIEQQMIERNQRFVPVVRGPAASAKVVGVITRTDLLRALHDDVLAAARARAKGQEEPGPSQYTRRRNVRSLLRERLNRRLYTLLEEAGRLADRLGLSVYTVGGFVRDLLLGIENLDLDLVIEGDGIAFARALAKQEGARVKVHDRFGTALVMLPNGMKVDVATARTEYYEYPTALPTVEQGSIKKDLYRRDFTINTLAIRLNQRLFGELVDFYGGQRDLHERAIRVLHSLSFVEDPTRVFRAIRFEHRFGFRLGKETLALIKGAVKMDLFHRLSGHRLLEELRLLLSELKPQPGLRRLADLDLLRFIHPRLTWSSRLASLVQAVEDALDWYKIAALDWPEGPAAKPWVVYLMALLEPLPARAVEDTLARLAVPASVAQTVRAGCFTANGILRRLAARPAPGPAQAYHLLVGLSDETLLLVLAKAKTESVKRLVVAFLAVDRRTKPALTGADLKALGLKPGPRYRQILQRLLDARLNGEVRTDEEERALAARLISA